MWPTELPDEKPLWKVPVKSYEQGYAAGFLAAQEKCVGIIDELLKNAFHRASERMLNIALTAIKAVKEG
jgi:hypothetical protein